MFLWTSWAAQPCAGGVTNAWETLSNPCSCGLLPQQCHDVQDLLIDFGLGHCRLSSDFPLILPPLTVSWPRWLWSQNPLNLLLCQRGQSVPWGLIWCGCGWGQETLLFPWVSLGHTPAWGPCVWKTLGALSPSLFQLCVLQSWSLFQHFDNNGNAAMSWGVNC